MSQYFLLVPLLLGTIITTFNAGFFSWQGLFVLLMMYGLLAYCFYRRNEKGITLPGLSSLTLLTVAIASYFIYFSAGIYQTNTGASYALLAFSMLVWILIPSYALVLHPIKPVKYRFEVLLGLALLLRLLMIAASPAPVIDIFTMFKESAQAFLTAQNPYEIAYSEVYPDVTTRFNYWPFAFIAQAPFVLLFHDPRMLLGLADIAAAYLLYWLGRKSWAGELLVIIYLFRPNALFIIEQSWSVPLEFLLLAGVAASAHKERLSGILLALLTAVKPVFFLLVMPAAIRFRQRQNKMLLAFVLALAVVIIPFFWWSPAGFIKNAVLLNVQKQVAGVTTGAPTTRTALNLDTLYYRLTGNDLPALVMPVVSLAALILVYEELRRRPHIKLSDAVLGMTLIFLSFCLFYKGAYINFYYLAADLVILWVVLLYREGALIRQWKPPGSAAAPLPTPLKLICG